QPGGDGMLSKRAREQKLYEVRAEPQIAPGRDLHGQRRGCNYSSSSRKGSASKAKAPRPIESMAATMRPLRPSMRSASETMRALGVAVAEARRSAAATAISSRSGLSAQAAT